MKKIIALFVVLLIVVGTYYGTMSEQALSHREKYIEITDESGSEITSEQLRDMMIDTNNSASARTEFKDKVYNKYRIHGKIKFDNESTKFFDDQYLLQSKYKYSNTSKKSYITPNRNGKEIAKVIFVIIPDKQSKDLKLKKEVEFDGVITHVDDDSITIKSEVVFNCLDS